MSSIAASLQKILDLASYYSPSSTTHMSNRAEIGNDLASELGNALPGLTGSLGLADLGLRTEPGGRQGYFSPLPWGAGVLAGLRAERPGGDLSRVHLRCGRLTGVPVAYVGHERIPVWSHAGDHRYPCPARTRR